VEKQYMLKAFATLLILGSVLVTATRAQGLPDQLNFSRSNVEGPHLYGVSANSSYSSYDFHSAVGTASTGRTTRTTYGVSATAGWQRFRGQTNFSVRYTGGYNGNVQYSNRNALHHSLVLGLARPLGRKWVFDLSATGLESDLSQQVFEPNNLVLLTQSGASFDDLAASQAIGQFSSIQNGLVLGGAGPTSAMRALLLGNRVLTYTFNTGLSYAYSSRLTFSFGSFALGGQHRTTDLASNISQNYVLPRTLGGTASASMSYSLSPRTSLSVSVGQNYTSSRYQKSMGTSPTFSLGRKMGKNWFLRGNAGVFISENIQQIVGTPPPARQATWGGSLGFRTHSNSFVGSYDRAGQSIGDAAATVGKNTIIRASWSWRPPRHGWNFNVNYSRTDTGNTGYLTIAGWQAGAGLNRSLGWNMVLAFNYAYLSSHSNFLGLGNQVNINSARVSLGWAPHLRRESQAAQDTDQ
jgi:hypothetical protein